MNVQLDTRKCKACWKCIDECPNRVLNKIDLPWHKHAIIADPGKCSACLKCVKACQYGALSKADKKTNYRSHVIYLLLFSVVLMIVSGLVLQLGFHMGSSAGQHEHARGFEVSKAVWGIIYNDWSTIHKFAIVLFSLLMIFHIKNKRLITLSILFLLVAITGYVPWLIDLSGSSVTSRLIFIEIHDKLALILVIYLILHIIKRRKWFMQ